MEEWRPMNLQTANAMDKLKEEMASAGIVNFPSYCKDPCFVKLSQTIVSYTRTLIPHCNAGKSDIFISLVERIVPAIYPLKVLKMYSEELYYPIIDSISELLRIIINVLTEAMRSVRDDDKSKTFTIQLVQL